METVNKILIISRYRFWSYTAGTYLLGYLLGVANLNSFISLEFLVSFVYFLLPANLFLYGVNDYFDRDADVFNQKKGTMEYRFKLADENFLSGLIKICVFISIIFILFLQPFLAKLTAALFTFLSYFYSATPLRFKTKPIIDSVSNVLYILPGIIGYLQTSTTHPPVSIIIGLWCWVMAMHLFSAIPDINSDKKANILTTAVYLGKSKSLLLCTFLWSVFFLNIYSLIPFGLGSALIIYPLIPLINLVFKSINLTKTYWYYPYINNIFGFLIFILIVESKLNG